MDQTIRVSMNQTTNHARQNLIFWFTVSAMFLLTAPLAIGQSHSMSGVVVSGKKYTGRVLYRSRDSIALLRRDGGMSIYPTDQVDSLKDLRRPFEPYSHGELEKRLKNEYPTRYTIVFTEHFAVVYPSDSTFAWSSTFERMYRLFAHYFEARGIELRQPEFPLIAIVLRTRDEFDEQLSRTELKDQANVRGFYSIKTNRVITYDQAFAEGSETNGDGNEATVIHEATHQSAFNTGIHERFHPLPRWVSEGLATMFEAPGVFNSVEFSELSDRVGENYLRELRSLIASGKYRGKIQSLVASDKLFDTDPRTAYAVSWGLTFFLVENRPNGYREFLQSTTKLPEFTRPSAEQRLADFSAVFGQDFRELETRIMQFCEGLESNQVQKTGVKNSRLSTSYKSK